VSKIAIVLELLGDGKWYGIEELQRRLGLDEREVQEIMRFLNKYDFVKVDKEHGKVKINRDFQKLLAKTVT
jgi:DNA-binding IclR family transcriptional regulator